MFCKSGPLTFLCVTTAHMFYRLYIKKLMKNMGRSLYLKADLEVDER